MKNLTLAFLALCLWSCKQEQNLVGRLDLQSPLQVQSKKGAVNFPVGVHESRLTIKGSKSLVIGARINGLWQSAEIKSSSSLKPDAAGKFSIPAAKLGQAFDIAGAVASQTVQTPPQTYSKTCQVGSRPGDTTCRNVWVPESCQAITECGVNALGETICKERGETCTGGYNQQECYQESIPVYGEVLVTSHQIIKTTRISVAIREPGSAREIGTFQGEERDVKNVGGNCR
ncbi:MAG: hypothetical protein V4736_00420 [Bdellovibrionota bacterium]